MSKVKITDIDWDYDKGDEHNLPTELIIDLDLRDDEDIDDQLGDYLSERFYFCVKSFKYQII